MKTFWNSFSKPAVAIDLGTANTRLALGNKFFTEVPTKISRRHLENKKTETVMPLRGGVVKDIPAATDLLKNLLRKTSMFFRPRVLICAPSDVTGEERTALFEATRQAGALNVTIIPEPLAAAVGTGLDISSPYAQMLVDIGDGVTDIAIIRDGDIVQTAAVRMAGSDMQRAIQLKMLERSVIISKTNAERLVCRLGSAADSLLDSMTVCGTDEAGETVVLEVRSSDVCIAIAPVIQSIVQTIVRAVREMPDTVCAEVAETGICLTGGIAKLPGMALTIEKETNLPVKLAPAPLNSVINGASRALESSIETNFWKNLTQ